MKKYIIALDAGTTSNRCIVYNKKGEIVSIIKTEFEQILSQEGWIEHDAIEIYNTILNAFIKAKQLCNIKVQEIAAIGITNQRETVVLWDKITGEPVNNAIVWQDYRTRVECEKIKAQYNDLINQKTGLLVHPYFSATKIKWILDNNPKAQWALEQNRLLAGTIDCWLLWKLTQGHVFKTDVTNASRTMLFNIHTLEWDDDILQLFKIPKQILPTVCDSNALFGYLNAQLILEENSYKIPITAVLGDQQAALFGSLAFHKGMIKNTYGTGCFSLINIGNQPIKSQNRLLTTIAWKLQNQKTIYALEGSVFIAGSVIKWLKNDLQIIDDEALCDFYCYQAAKKNKPPLYVVPAFNGLGAPYWDSNARGIIIGLDKSTKKADLIKATIESIAYQTDDLLKAIEQDLGQKITHLKADGGVSNSNYLLEFQANISNVLIERNKNVETTATGVAYLAGLSVKFWKSQEELQKISLIERIFRPNWSPKTCEQKRKGWNEAVKRSRHWTINY